MAVNISANASCEEVYDAIKKGFIDSTDGDGNTFLHVTKRVSVTHLLVAQGADVNSKNAMGRTPLHRVYHVDQVKLLVDNGCSPDDKDDSGDTALHLASSPEIVRELVKLGSDVDARNNAGETPIHKCTYGPKRVILVKAGADIDAADSRGRTVLMKMARSSYPTVLMDVLKLNPSSGLKSKSGSKAIDFAYGDTMRSIIEEYSARGWKRRRHAVLAKEFRGRAGDSDKLGEAVLDLSDELFRNVLEYL